MTITHDALEFIVPPPIPPKHGTWVPPNPIWGLGTYPYPTTDIWWSSLENCSNLFTLGPTPALILTHSGGHQDMYGWQAGGTHPIGMLFLFNIRLTTVKFENLKCTFTQIFLGSKTEVRCQLSLRGISEFEIAKWQFSTKWTVWIFNFSYKT